eukprot:7775385-Alexandrium_andersonii.AAC.1
MMPEGKHKAPFRAQRFLQLLLQRFDHSFATLNRAPAVSSTRGSATAAVEVSAFERHRSRV